jgi:hypothetical protein
MRITLLLHLIILLTLIKGNGENIQSKISFSAGERLEYTLFLDRKSEYRITISAQASESEQWAARNRMNGSMGFRQQTGGVESYMGVHTFYTFMPPSEFYDKHPEYYSLIDGRRVIELTDGKHVEPAQLCLSNPDVLKIMTERIKNYIRENPENMIYDVSQNDTYNPCPCQCEKCQAIVRREGGEPQRIKFHESIESAE